MGIFFSSEKIDWNSLLENPDKPWNWYNHREPLEIDWDSLLENPDKPWDC
jgi:hypothetical protein